MPSLEPQLIGKASTATQFLVFACASSTHAFGWPPAGLAEPLHVAALCVTGASAASYYFASRDVFATGGTTR